MKPLIIFTKEGSSPSESFYKYFPKLAEIMSSSSLKLDSFQEGFFEGTGKLQCEIKEPLSLYEITHFIAQIPRCSKEILFDFWIKIPCMPSFFHI